MQDVTKKDMTEIAQVIANGVVRVYMGAGGFGGGGLPGASFCGHLKKIFCAAAETA